jgi:hypothetical protein
MSPVRADDPSVPLLDRPGTFTRMDDLERRTPISAYRLSGDLAVDVLVPARFGAPVVLPGVVLELGDSTVTIAMGDGAAALTVATTKRCVLVWGPEGSESCALVRTGRRVDDVHSPTTLELVLEEVRPLADLAPA